MGEASRTFALAHSVSVPIARHESLYRSLLGVATTDDAVADFSSTAREVLGQVG